MSLFNLLASIFLIAGITLMGAAWYWARLSRRYRRSLAALLHSIKPQNDPLQLPQDAWPTLAQGGIALLTCSGKWYGQQVGLMLGVLPDNPSRGVDFIIEAEDDVRLEFHLYPVSSKGEARLFAEHLASIFRLQMEAAVQIKVSALAATMAEQARLTLYLQHDLRNLSQWVNWISDDFASAEDETELLNTAKRVAKSVPHAAARAQRILASTRKQSPDQMRPQGFDLTEAITHAAELAGIAVEVAGNARVYMRRDLLERALDNIFSNVSSALRARQETSLPVTISREGQYGIARIVVPQLSEVKLAHPEKLFEPFSSGRVGGLGLGLYQARKSLREAGGELSAEIGMAGIQYQLALPAEYAE